MNPRITATKILQDIIKNHKSLTPTLSYYFSQAAAPKDQPLTQALVYGVLRWYWQLEFVAHKLLKKPLKNNDFDMHLLILIGLYQLIYLKIPQFAAVSETVEAAKTMNKPWAVDLINAVLRRFIREMEHKSISQKSDDLQVIYSHPHWLIKKLQRDWPEHWQAILTANNQHPPLTLRINQRKISSDHYLQKLAAVGIDATLISGTPSGVIITNPIPVSEIPGFFTGEVSVQDGASQLAATLLQLQPNLRVLDACAAPGGKSALILESEPHLKELVAIDIDQQRVKRIEENLARLELTATTIVGDATNPSAWWDNQLFDRILLDAPCSATGVIRRHPDIKFLRQANDISALANNQQQLIKKLWPLLKPNGILVYSTCSIFPDENVNVITQFLAQTANAKEIKIDATWGRAMAIGRQILPGDGDMDGFYYGVLTKIGD